MLNKTKNDNFNILIVICLVILFGGCSSLQPFNKDTRSANALSAEDLKYVQYYISSPLTLVLMKRNIVGKVTEDNEIKRDTELYEKRILIDTKTPGVATETESLDEITIAFDDDLTLGFRISDKSFDTFRLYSINGERVENKSTISFRGEKYAVRYGSYNTFGTFSAGPSPALLYEFTASYKERRESEQVKGKRVK